MAGAPVATDCHPPCPSTHLSFSKASEGSAGRSSVQECDLQPMFPSWLCLVRWRPKGGEKLSTHLQSGKQMIRPRSPTAIGKMIRPLPGKVCFVYNTIKHCKTKPIFSYLRVNRKSLELFTKFGWQNLHCSKKEILKIGKILDFLKPFFRLKSTFWEFFEARGSWRLWGFCIVLGTNR